LKILVTGAAGFIGYHLCRALLSQHHEVSGIDNLNSYYDVKLKEARLANLANELFTFHKLDITEAENLFEIIGEIRPEILVHLAAQAGVRHSIRHPQSFIDSNIQGFFNVLEACRKFPVEHLVYASSSSVYGANSPIPFTENARTNQPVSLYGATKKASEVLTHSYAALYRIPSTGLRFFTVYGPWGRPDMAYYKFANQIIQGETIELYNEGRMERDFTYIDDIIYGVISILDVPPQQDSSWHRILNIGRGHPVNLMQFVETLEKHLGRSAEKKYLPLQEGELERTWADPGELQKLTGYSPSTDLDEGIRNFVLWYKSYLGIS
jgi:UDP-glucuronate 4-epimerase